MNEIVVNIIFDDSVNVYVATSDDVPGLVAESETLDALKNKVLQLIPLLIDENKHLIGSVPTVPVDLLIRQREMLAIA